MISEIVPNIMIQSFTLHILRYKKQNNKNRFGGMLHRLDGIRGILELIKVLSFK